ncbi:uncharacterized protein [Littorina saxatilis]|uniref:Galectin n=1 Tax=Littorina saxatilis TaxID=31220 RepID=A0AAN9GQR8_9CAEN
MHVTMTYLQKHLSLVVLVLLQRAVNSDVLQSTTFSNTQQCHRLCWYRPPCVAYSVTTDVIASDVTCILHSDPVKNADIPSGWQTTTATAKGISNSCAVRHCSLTQVCVPSLTSHTCLTLQLDCGVPPSLPGSVFAYNGTGVGQEAILTCASGYGMAPYGRAQATMTCQSNGQWSTLTDHCQKVEFDAPSVPFIKRLPWQLDFGWKSCFRGTFLGNGQMVFNFLADEEDYLNKDVAQYQNVALQIAFRDHFDVYRNITSFSRKVSNVWGSPPLQQTADMPLTPGDPFTLTFDLSFEWFEATLQGAGYTAKFPSQGIVNFNSVVHLGIAQDLQLTYVHLTSAAGCTPPGV